MALLGAAALWGSVASVDRIATATGVFAPQGQVRTIQHLEGGIVAEIMVREGEVVTAAQPLLRIDLGSGGLDPEDLTIKLDALVIERARLQAEAMHIDLHLPEEESNRRPELAQSESSAFLSRRREFESSIAVLESQQQQKGLEIDSIVARLEAARARLMPLQEQINIADRLSQAQLMRRTEALSLEREKKRLEGEIAALSSALPLAQTALAEVRQRTLLERNQRRNQAAERIREIEIEISKQRQLLERASEQTRRRVVKSPIAGVVKNLRLHTIGGVLQAGDPIMEIVPNDEKLIVEGRLTPDDVGHVRAGQPVKVKISTYDYMRYGALDGRISHVAADASRSNEGDYFFRLIIETEQDFLEVGDERYAISPGMTAAIDINLGRRPVWRYLVDPVLKFHEHAFRDQ